MDGNCPNLTYDEKGYQVVQPENDRFPGLSDF